MKKIFTKTIALLLALTLTFSLITISVSAEEEKTAAQAVEELDKNIPIIEIPGFGDQPIFKGVLTETLEDDIDVWSFDTGTLVSAIFKGLPNIIYSLVFGNYNNLDGTLSEILGTIFGNIACDNDGVPSEDTGILYHETVLSKEEYGKENSYYFGYDWRLDMHTISSQLDEFVNEVLEVTGAEEVGLVSFSMGGAVMLTYLYEHYYIGSEEDRAKIHSAIFLSGAMNGVECCGDPFSGNINFTSKSLLRMLYDLLAQNESTAWLGGLMKLIYESEIFESLVSYTNDELVPNLNSMAGNAVLKTIGTVPAFYGLMSSDRYYATEEFLFDTPEKRETYAGIIEKSRYYHENVQANKDEIIEMFIADGKNFAIVSEYGYNMLPVTSDNDRMSDGMIGTYSTSFGATCSEIDKTLGDNYVQAKECACGKNHISPDNQIDASTCKYPDITWFAKNLKHVDDDRYFADFIDLITYSEEHITVHTYSDLPQYLINVDDSCLVPMTTENCGSVIPFDSNIIDFFKKLLKK